MKINQRLVSIVLSFTAIYAVPTSAQLADDVYAEVDGVKIDKAIVDTLLDGQPQQGQIRGLIEQLVTSIILAKKAEAEGYLERPDIKIELDMVHQAALGRAYLRDFLLANQATNEEIEVAFNEFKALQTGQKEYRIRHILVEDKALADELILQINGDQNRFINLAVEYSIDPGSKETGGDLGWAPPNAFVPEFSEAMVSLQPGQVSGPVQTQFGWHILYLDDVRDSRAPDLTPEFREQIAERINQQKIAEAIETLRQEANVELNEAAISGVEQQAN